MFHARVSAGYKTAKSSLLDLEKYMFDQHSGAAWKPKTKQQTQQSVPSEPSTPTYHPEGLFTFTTDVEAISLFNFREVRLGFRCHQGNDHPLLFIWFILFFTSLLSTEAVEIFVETL